MNHVQSFTDLHDGCCATQAACSSQGELCFFCSFVKEHAAGSQQNSNTSMQNLREICEQALTAAGLHITLGGSLWDAYR